MKTVSVAVRHEFTYRDDGVLVCVSPPPLTVEGGWDRLIRESEAAPEAYKVLRPWNDGEAIQP